MTWYAVDGMDGCGKTTISTMLRERLESQGRKVLEITHPNESNVFGKLAKRYLCVHNKLGQTASTVFYILDVVCSLFKKKRIGKRYDDVIFVRYSLAAAYLPKGAVRKGYDIIEHVLPVPDVKIFVDSKPKVCMERVLERGEELEIFETEEKLDETREKMKLITDSWIVVDNSGTIEETRKRIEELV